MPSVLAIIMLMRIINLFLLSVIFMAGCQTQKEDYFIKKAIPRKGKIAVLIRGDNEVKNAAFIRFLQAGYNVVGINGADFYTLDDIFDVKSFRQSVQNIDVKGPGDKITAAMLDRMFDNVYKLHIYNFEVSKAEFIQNLKDKWKVDYLVLISMSNWQKGYSWIRVVNTDNLEIEYVHNYSAGRLDTFQTILARMIDTMSQGPSK